MKREDTPIFQQARKLAHDVGKYISRAARNFGDTPLSAPLLALFLQDLYALDGARPASRVFEDIAQQIEAMIGPNRRLADCRAMLCRIDALEQAVRSTDWPSIQEAAFLAIEIDNTLRLFADEVGTKDDQ